MTSTPALLAAAQANLSDAAWDKLIGGTESETTLRRNRMGFDSLAFRPRIQSRDAAVDASSTFLGHRIRIPVMLSPIGSLHRFTPDGSLAAARAAGEFGSDVVKALALGARAAMIGKLQGIGLAAAGESGLRAVLEILEDEIVTCLELLGAAGADELEADHLRPARPVNLPTDTSAFGNWAERS